MFALLLKSLIQENIDQVCVVFDRGETENIQLFKRFAEEYQGQIDARFSITTKPGKRAGLAEAIAMTADVDIIMAMDSDTQLGNGVKQAILAAFGDPRIGGVTIAQRVYQPKNWVHQIFDLLLFLRYWHDISGQALGGRISCLSGRCSAYLAQPLKEVAPDLLTESWAGIRKTGGGDDKLLTTRIHDKNYYTTLVRNVFVYTRSEHELLKFLKQRLRWGRNSWFSDLRALFTRRWMWQSPILLFYTLDRMVSSFTIMLSPWLMIYFIVTLNWEGILLILLWWLVSRTIKTLPYLLQTHRFHILPLYIAMTFVLGAVNIHALVTMGESSWMSRGASGQKLQSTAMMAITFMILLGLGGLIFRRELR
jgi:cellulose synthase/poly-beta-1,6-N-acetylglucosamine synthase-like glycosyltransferase